MKDVEKSSAGRGAWGMLEACSFSQGREGGQRGGRTKDKFFEKNLAHTWEQSQKAQDLAEMGQSSR